MDKLKESEDISDNEGQQFEKGLRAENRRIVLLLVLGIVFLNLALDSTLGWTLRQSRDRYEKSAETDVDNISGMLEQNIRAQFHEIDLTLQTVADLVAKSPSVVHPGNKQFASFLQVQTSRLPKIIGLRIIDSKGNLTYATGDVTSANVNVADRDHFTRVRDDPRAGLVIGEPLLGRVSHQWVLILSRRLSCADGSFCGEVHASIPLAAINRIFSTLDLGPHGVMSMWNKTMTIARYPEEVGGRNVIGIKKPSPQLRSLLEANIEHAIYRATAPTDNVRKTYSIRRIGEFSLWTIAGQAEQDYLAPWRHEVLRVALIGLMFAVISMLLAWQIYRHWRLNRLRMSGQHHNLELFKNLLNRSNEAIFVNDLQTGRFIDVNDRTCASLGFSRAELLQLGVRDIEAGFSDDLKWQDRIQELKRKGFLLFEGVHKRKDRTTFPVETNISFVELGGREYMIAVARDITERKQADAALREREMQLAESQRIAHMGSWEHNPKTGDIYWSDELFRLLGLDPAKDRADFTTFFSRIHPDDRPVLRAAVEASLREKKPLDVEYRFIVPDEPVKIIHARADLVPDAAGELSILRGTGQDITERKKAEEDHKKLEEQLRHAQKLEGIGTLAGGIAHDFNNILSAIIGYGHITLMKMPKDDPLRLNIESMLESADRAAALTQSLLAFSRKQITDRKPVELNSLIMRVEKFLVRIIGEDISVRLNLAKGTLNIFADAGQLEQVFMNLATNARDAMPKGGSFTIETMIGELDSGYITAHGYGKEGTYAMICATDTGVGMTEETKQKIFEPFFTTKEVGKGTGLGLAMVYGILKQHEGLINVYSEPGKGTTFRIYLPLIKAAAVDEKIAVTYECPECGTETVLVAEDDAILRKLDVLVLEQMGYTVITAKDGEEAVTKFMENKDRIQLLLFDMIMPKKDGKEAYEEIRKVRPDVPVLFASGYSPDMLSDKALIEKGAAFVYKPISPLDLSKKVREVLDKNR